MTDINSELIEKAAQALHDLRSLRSMAFHEVGQPLGDTVYADERRADARAALFAVAADIRAEAWDEGHRTPQQREMDDCHCYASSASECACGRFGTGRIITPNPYRKGNLT